MGRLAEALRANLKSVAASDARALREIDQELKAAMSGVVPVEVQLTGQVDAKALLGKGSFKQQTVTTLRRICKENGIKGFSKLKMEMSLFCESNFSAEIISSART